MKSAIFFLSLVAATAHAYSTGTRGGGKGVLCTTPGGKSLTSLDRYEAGNVYHYVVPASQSYAEERARMIRKMTQMDHATIDPFAGWHASPEEMSQVFTSMFSEVESRFQFIPSGAHLLPTEDTDVLPTLPAACSFAQIIVQNLDDGSLDVDKSYWELLSPQDQAVLVFHEVDYNLQYNLVDKEFRHTPTSRLVREEAARLVSDLDFPDVYAPIRTMDQAIGCGDIDGDENIRFYVVPKGEGSELYFSKLNALDSMSITTADSSLPYAGWAAGASRKDEALAVSSEQGRQVVHLKMEGTSGSNLLGSDPALWTMTSGNGRAVRISCSLVKR